MVASPSWFVKHVGKVLLEVIADRLSGYCESKGIFPEEQGWV